MGNKSQIWCSNSWRVLLPFSHCCHNKGRGPKQRQNCSALKNSMCMTQRQAWCSIECWIKCEWWHGVPGVVNRKTLLIVQEMRNWRTLWVSWIQGKAWVTINEVILCDNQNGKRKFVHQIFLHERILFYQIILLYQIRKNALNQFWLITAYYIFSINHQYRICEIVQ